MADILGYLKVEQMAENSFKGLLSGAFTAAASGTTIFVGMELPSVGNAYDSSGAMTLPHVTIYCESVTPATPDSREHLYNVAMSIIIRTSIREDTNKSLINLYSSFIRFILANQSLADELNLISPNPSNSYKYTSATSTTENLEFKRVRVAPESEISRFKVSSKYYEITHNTICLIGVA